MKKLSWFLIFLGLVVFVVSWYISNNNYFSGTNETILNADLLDVLLYLGPIVAIVGLLGLFLIKRK